MFKSNALTPEVLFMVNHLATAPSISENVAGIFPLMYFG